MSKDPRYPSKTKHSTAARLARHPSPTSILPSSSSPSSIRPALTRDEPLKSAGNSLRVAPSTSQAVCCGQTGFGEGMASRDISDPMTSDSSSDDAHSLVEESSHVQSQAPGHPSDTSTASPPATTARVRSSISGDSDATIRENISPSLYEAFGSSPLFSPRNREQQTASTESTESTHTIRGDVAQASDSMSARTPSYPFPRMPSRVGSFKRGPTPLHQPFTVLSPTLSSGDNRPQNRARERFERLNSQTGSGLMLPSSGEHTKQKGRDSDFSAPNLYDIVLQLNSELALDTWWASLIKIMRENYKVDRMSIAVPVDSSDIEGVPWAQKLSYDANGIKSSQISIGKARSNRSDQSENFLTRPIRPHLESRHSYAGYEATRLSERDTSQIRPTSATRPPNAQRSAAQNSPRKPVRSRVPPSTETENISEPAAVAEDFELAESHLTQDNSQERVYSRVYSSLNVLDKEHDPLLEPASVNRMLDRGSMIILTRNFTDEELPHGSHPTTSQGTDPTSFDKPRNSSLVDNSQYQQPSSSLVYEDFEQIQSTPSWSESPAPSPAIQNDPEENPFFASATVTEESFEPSSPQKEDYTNVENIEAIGIDNAYTVIHLPLIHPSLSKPFESKIFSFITSPGAETTGGEVEGQARQNEQKRIPIAILSISSRDVPYHPNLAQSLKDLGPHLATSFNTCLQNSNIQERISKALQRKHRAGQIDFSSSVEGIGLTMGLESLLQYEDDRSSTIESVRSPSEQSIPSNASPWGSAAGTPALESAPQSTGTRGTPVEAPGEYFGMHAKRISIERSRSSNVVPQSQQKSPNPTKAIPWEHRSVLQRIEPTAAGESSTNQNRKEQKRTKGRESHSHSTTQAKSTNKGQPTQSSVQAENQGPRHSLLHSLGADFKASFQTLPSTATPKTHRPDHSRTTSASDTFTMPPPSERLLRLIIDGLPVQIFTAEPMSGKLTWVNSKLLQYGARTPENALNEPWETIHAEDRESYMQEWTSSLQTGKQFQHKVRLRRYDDVYRYFYVRATPLRTNEQRIVHWFGTMIDLHDQHLAELNAARQQETAASEAKYRALANSSPQIVFAINPKRGVSFSNTQWTAYSGQTEEEAKGTGFMDQVHPDDLEKCKLPSFEDDASIPTNVPISVPTRPQRSSSGTSSAESEVSGSTPNVPISSTGIQMPQRKLSELAATGILRVIKDATGKLSYSTEVRLRSKDGEYRWHLVRLLLAEPLIQTNAKEETWYGTCTDINDHKVLEQTLKETMDAKSRFLSNMSHEIRTPLNGIWGMTNFLIDTKLTSEQMDHVNVIRASTEGLRDLINDILDLSKVEAGMIRLTMDWLNVRSLIEEVNDLTSSLSLDKGIELNYLVESNVPPVLKGDRFRFRQILLNVIGNAIKFTDEGEVFVHCSITAEPTAEAAQSDSIILLIEVKDTGAGFSESEAERLFKRFSQIDGSSTRQHDGSGLGLVISMQLVELHGGTMTATSAVGKGSNFSFTIKFGLPSDTATSHPTLRPSAVASPLGDVDPKDSMASQRLTFRNSRTSSPAVTESPAAYAAGSPSSAASDTSKPTVRTSVQSSRSSWSSRASADAASMKLEIRPDARQRVGSDQGRSEVSGSLESSGPSGPVLPTPDIPQKPPIYSILVVCELPWMREATVGHLEAILTRSAAHEITTRESYGESVELIEDEDIVFTHVVICVRDVNGAAEIMSRVFRSSPLSTSVVVISDMKQRNDLAHRRTPFDSNQMTKINRLQFIQKPIKPSKLAAIFDPSRSAELSTDENQSSAQQAAIDQKRLFDEMTRRLGDKDIRVLLVEDNPINQMVMLKLLQRVSVGVETVADGVQATEKVFSKSVGYYSIILMDLMMPNKDGYETCRDIRGWEARNEYAMIPIVALSANVLDDVWRKCRDAGFSSYLTKPVEFKELSDVMMAFLDPEDPSKPVAFMRTRVGGGIMSAKR